MLSVFLLIVSMFFSQSLFSHQSFEEIVRDSKWISERNLDEGISRSEIIDFLFKAYNEEVCVEEALSFFRDAAVLNLGIGKHLTANYAINAHCFISRDVQIYMPFSTFIHRVRPDVKDCNSAYKSLHSCLFNRAADFIDTKIIGSNGVELDYYDFRMEILSSAVYNGMQRMRTHCSTAQYNKHIFRIKEEKNLLKNSELNTKKSRDSVILIINRDVLKLQEAKDSE